MSAVLLEQALAGHSAVVALLQSGNTEEALAACRRALQLDSKDAAAWFLLGMISLQLADAATAAAAFGEALLQHPEDAMTHVNRGSAYSMLNQHQRAIECYEKAIELDPNSNASPYYNRATSLQALGQYEGAIASYDQAIALESDLDADAYYGRAASLLQLQRYAAAIESADQAIALESRFSAEAYACRGTANAALGDSQLAMSSFQNAVAIKPDYAEAHNELGKLHAAQKTWSEALASYERAVRVNPGIRGLLGERCHAKMHLCDWRNIEADLAQVRQRIERDEAACAPFPALSLFKGANLQRRAAAIYVRQECPPSFAPAAMPKYARHEKIRVGYFSGDFYGHPVSFLTAGLYETHDRSRFDVLGFSLGPYRRDEMRIRLEKAFDHLLDVRSRDERSIAELARSMELDIAVDLGGFTENSRPKIFAARAAPLQVSYVGFLGTMAAPYIDYLIADPTLVPAAHRQHYSEKILYLPSYQANDSKRPIAQKIFSREELGLPATGFVFCCFNAHNKITPDTYSHWMRVLTRVPGSVLFLLAGHPMAEDNLRHEALHRGVDPSRLVFGGWLPAPEYLARYRAADLFLDTQPYNAGTTASDALWAGLPVLTILGQTFAGRMAASLLHAVGLPELIASSPEHYENLAVNLATDPTLLAAIREKLAKNRLTSPLFDTRRFTGNVEAAYETIYQRYMAGLPPEDVDLGRLLTQRIT